MHAAEVAAHARANSLRIAYRYRVRAGTEFGRRLYLVIVIVAAVRSPVGVAAVGAVTCRGTRRTGYQPGTGIAHRQPVLGVRLHRRILGGLGRRPAVVPDRFPIQIAAVGQLGGIDQPLRQHPLVDRVVGSRSRRGSSSAICGNPSGSGSVGSWAPLVGSWHRWWTAWAREAKNAEVSTGACRGCSATGSSHGSCSNSGSKSNSDSGSALRPPRPGTPKMPLAPGLRCGNSVTGSSECPLS